MGPKRSRRYLPKVTPEVQEAKKFVVPTRVTADARNSLLPYLALGFTPVKTSGVQQLCGINALWRSFKEARIALQPPNGPDIRHLTQKDFKDLLSGKVYEELADEYLENNLGVNQILDEDVRQEQIDNVKRTENLDLTQLNFLLKAANQ
jgi:hypothetical protein